MTSKPRQLGQVSLQRVLKSNLICAMTKWSFWVLQNRVKSHKFAFVRYKRASLGAFERLKWFSNESFSYRCKRTIRQ